ncbi:hypothetical protein AB0K43_12385 [Kitasatospora sp. NPDC049258]|uniref:hypothetical protein n=1 Tax=Kitasatospora sp. NPDC049258 TaxID=3155394 RepID=UPI00342AB01F
MTEHDGPTAEGPRHAAPRVGVRSRLRGRALAIAAVPTALLVGAAYAPTLAMADSKTTCASAPDTVIEETPVPQSEIKVAPEPGAQAPTTAPTTEAGKPTGTPTATPTATATTATAKPQDAAAQAAAARVSPAGYSTVDTGRAVQTSAPRPAGLIDDIVDGIFHPGGGKSATPSPVPTTPGGSSGAPATPPPAASASAAPSAAASPSAPAPAPAAPARSAAAQASGSPAGKAPASKPKTSAAPTASPSASAGPNCAVDTSHMAARAATSGHVVPEQNWTLKSSRLALHGSVFNGVYDVKTPTGSKRVLKFTTASVDIGNLDMSTIQIPGLTFHVKSAPNSTSTMRNGPITMYVERLSGHLSEIYGLPIPIDLGEITLTPDTLPRWLWDLLSGVPIPLDITLDNATAVQAGQFGGTLKIPGMKLYNDDTPYEN